MLYDDVCNVSGPDGQEKRDTCVLRSYCSSCLGPVFRWCSQTHRWWGTTAFDCRAVGFGRPLLPCSQSSWCGVHVWNSRLQRFDRWLYRCHTRIRDWRPAEGLTTVCTASLAVSIAASICALYFSQGVHEPHTESKSLHCGRRSAADRILKAWKILLQSTATHSWSSHGTRVSIFIHTGLCVFTWKPMFYTSSSNFV